MTRQPIDTEPWRRFLKWIVKRSTLYNTVQYNLNTDSGFTMSLKETVTHLIKSLIPTSNMDGDMNIEGLPDEQYLKTIHEESLWTIVRKQKDRSPDKDGITIKIIKACWDAIKKPLTDILMIVS